MKARDQRKRRRPQAQKPYKRLLHFADGEVWSWRCGHAYVQIRTPDNQTNYKVPLPDITGWSWSELERGEWKGYWPGITPQEVKDYIELHLRPDPAMELPEEAYVHPMFTKPDHWHLYFDCRFLPNTARHNSIDPERVPRESLAERFGQEPTRRNVCAICMHRREKKEAA